MLKGIIFDFDGTIGDTMFACMDALRRTLAPVLGRSISDEEIYGYFGPSEDGVFLKHFPDRADELLAEYLRHYRVVQEETAPEPFPGILELIAELKNRGVRVALVTAKGAGSCKISLEIYGAEELFETIEVGSPYRRDKANSIHKALETMNLTPDEVAYVGDSPKDVASSREAGVEHWAAAWAPAVDPEKLAELDPDKLFRTVEEMRAHCDEIF
ncbi:MAG: HAD family hydrolase [Thermoguttaceae bacterium]|nr:HAD family hydrolase [Thermoguttaceae bacterium]